MRGAPCDTVATINPALMDTGSAIWIIPAIRLSRPSLYGGGYLTGCRKGAPMICLQPIPDAKVAGIQNKKIPERLKRFREKARRDA